MKKNIKSALPIIGLMVILSFVLTGCYTQLSRPRVNVDDGYASEYDEDDYYQDQEAPYPSDQSGGDTYINNYYSSFDPYFDYWNYYPYSWRYYNWSYLGPYPDFYWDPYGRWWMPGWYAGYYYYGSWGGRYPRYYDGYYTTPSQRNYTKRTFGRGTIPTAGRDQRIIDTQTGLARPQSPTRVERPTTTLAAPEVREKAVPRDAIRLPNQDKRVRTIPDPNKRKTGDAVKPQTNVKPRQPQRGTEVQKTPPRDSRPQSKPGMIDTAPKKSPDRKDSKSYKPAQRSSSRSTPARSSGSQVSRPATRSETPRSSSTTRSSGSSSSSGSKESSSSKSSGSSKTERK